MLALFKVFLVFATVVFLIRKKVPLGISLVSGAILVAILFKMDISAGAAAFLDICIQADTRSFVLLIALALALSMVLEKSGQIDRLTESLRQFVTSRKLASAMLPAIVGFLPMPGGALFSAPMVEAATSDLPIDNDKKVEINHWFRHIWEYFWPLYPGVIYTANLLNLEVKKFSGLQFPITIMAIISGFIFVMRRVRVPPKAVLDMTSSGSIAVLKFIVNLSPFLLIFVLYLLVNIPLLLSLACVLFLTSALNIIFKKTKFLHLVRSIFTSAGFLNFLVMAYGVKLFGGILSKSGAIYEMSIFFVNSHLPVLLIVILFPLIIGFVAGITIVYCSATFPLILALPDVTANPIPYIVLAFTAGFSGTMLSPIHACLSLTNQYFCARLTKVILHLILPMLCVLATGFALYLLYSYWLPF
jgi:integral membrane protein (TIGR00529 family)